MVPEPRKNHFQHNLVYTRFIEELFALVDYGFITRNQLSLNIPSVHYLSMTIQLTVIHELNFIFQLFRNKVKIKFPKFL